MRRAQCDSPEWLHHSRDMTAVATAIVTLKSEFPQMKSSVGVHAVCQGCYQYYCNTRHMLNVTFDNPPDPEPSNARERLAMLEEEYKYAKAQLEEEARGAMGIGARILNMLRPHASDED